MLKDEVRDLEGLERLASAGEAKEVEQGFRKARDDSSAISNRR